MIARFLKVSRPDAYGRVVAAHAPWAFASGFLLLVSLFVPYPEIPFRICGFYRLFTRPCPFCGFSRSFGAMSDGDPGWAAVNNPAAVLLYAVVAIVFLWNLSALVLRRRIHRGPWLTPTAGQGRKILLGVVALLLVNWAYRWAMGLD